MALHSTTIGPEHPQFMINTLLSEIGTLPIITSSSNELSSKWASSLSTIVLAAASKKAIPPDPQEPPTIEAARRLLPKYATAKKLAEHYTTNIYPRLPFFSIPRILTQFNYVYSSSPSSSSPTSREPPDPSIGSPPSPGETSLSVRIAFWSVQRYRP